jgi:hypothetical protein
MIRGAGLIETIFSIYFSQLSEYNRRQRTAKWLETHIWHAKRFHMSPATIVGNAAGNSGPANPVENAAGNSGSANSVENAAGNSGPTNSVENKTGYCQVFQRLIVNLHYSIRCFNI